VNSHNQTVSRVRAALIGLLLLTLAGCSFWRDDDDRERCVSVEEYQDARTAPEISIPAGLDRPDGSARLYVPPGPEPSEPLSQNAGCLTEPPDYFDKPLIAP
jgi:uncharacterized lipoprotein